MNAVRLRISWSALCPGRAQRSRCLHQVAVEAPLESLQAASLRVGQIVGDVELADVRKNSVEVRQPPFQLGSAIGQDRRGVRRERASRIGQDRAAVRLVSDPVGRHEDRSVRGTQAVLERRLKNQVLVLCRKRSQRVRRGCREAPGRELFAGPVRQASRQLQAERHPARLLLQHVRDGTRGESVVADEGGHDPRLVQCGESPGRRVGHQHRPLVVDGSHRMLHDHRNGPVSRGAPPFEPLEPVQELVVLVVGVGRHHAQRSVGERHLPNRRLTRAQTSKAGADAVDGKVAHRAALLRARRSPVRINASHSTSPAVSSPPLPARRRVHHRSPHRPQKSTPPADGIP